MTGEMKRMLTGKSFLAAWLIACLSLAAGASYPNLKKVLECGTFLRLLNGSLESQVLSFAIPVAAVLPWSDSFLQEYKSGFLKAVLPRTDRRRYVEGKVFSVTDVRISGLDICSTYHAFYQLCYILSYGSQEAAFPKELLFELLQKALRLGITGGILSTFGGICGILGNSVYMAYGIPFVTYYFGIILHERYFKEQIWFYPVEWISVSGNWGFQKDGLFLFLLLLLLVLILIFEGVLYGKIQEI